MIEATDFYPLYCPECKELALYCNLKNPVKGQEVKSENFLRSDKQKFSKHDRVHCGNCNLLLWFTIDGDKVSTIRMGDCDDHS